MSSLTEESNVFVMDSGPFLDIIPTILQYLDLKSLVNLSQTCQFWKRRIYSDIKLWPNVIELPYIGHMDTRFNQRHTDADVINAKIWSALLPPEDPNALEKLLTNIALSEESIQRFIMVEKVQFKNFIHTDESLRLTALLFPSITEISFEGDLLTIDGIRYIATSCNHLKHIEFYQCNRIDIPSAIRLFNTDEHKENLTRIFIYSNGSSRRNKRTLRIEDDLPFMAQCERCGLYFNKLKNEKEMLCLYHPGIYSGYGHSCSSYDCCGSSTPRYPSTLGCQYTYHKNYDNVSLSNTNHHNEMHDGLPEFMFQKYTYRLNPLIFMGRRSLDDCYKKWNNEQTLEEK